MKQNRLDGAEPPTADYSAAAAGFCIEDAEGLLQGNLMKAVNVCVECCDRHATPGRVALEFESRDGDRSSYTFADLKGLSARFANFLKAQGILPGDVVAAMLPRRPELVVTILGTWRAGAVYQPLFTAFGANAVEHRLETSSAKMVITDSANRSKFDGLGSRLKIAVVNADGYLDAGSGDLDFCAELDRNNDIFEPVMRSGSDHFLMMSTSGTTGLPKGVPVPIRALMSFHIYMRDAIDLRADDKFWNMADPGWAYGLYYAITGPLLLGYATTLFEGPFSVESTYRIIDSHRITNLAGAPTAYRLLIAAGKDVAAKMKGRLRVVSSAGEPLNPEVIRWFDENLAAPIHDHYGQTELGMVVNNHHRLRHEVYPGSAGFAMPGYRVAVLGDDGHELKANVPGVLAVDIGNSPLFWFPGYWQQPTAAIAGGYYLTGDIVELEPDGRISFMGRSDDVITSSGYRIGPFEVESALLEHPAVVEAAVIGKPDLQRTEIIKAFVILHPDSEPSEALAEELRLYVKRHLSAHAYPREIEFVDQLPKTPSGKLQRFILRRNEVGT